MTLELYIYIRNQKTDFFYFAFKKIIIDDICLTYKFINRQIHASLYAC